MKNIIENKLDILLSQYIDGVLSEKDIRKVESLLAADESIRRHMAELQRLRELLTAKQKLTPDIGFWTRFSLALEDKKREEKSLFPFPRKYIPVAALLTTVVTAVVGIFIVQNRMKFLQLFKEKSRSVHVAYNENLLKGSLLPLFSKVDKDHALQFSLFGTLRLDEKSETALCVDEQSKKGYRIEFGKDLKRKTKPVTLDSFLAEIKPTNNQKRIIDSLLELTGRRIESSVLIGENNAMAIAPDLPRLNKIMVTNIASCLEPNQQDRFEQLLEANDAPYTIKIKTPAGEKRNHFFQNIPSYPQDDRFVVVTPDTMIYSQIHIDFDSLRQQMEEDLASFKIRREEMLKNILKREFQNVRRNMLPPSQVQNIERENYFSIEITSQADENELKQMHFLIQPRVRKHLPGRSAPGRSIEMHEWRDTGNPVDTVQK